MKNKFNFLQIANWLYVCKCNLDIIYKDKTLSDDQIIEKIKIEKRKISILKDVLKRNSNIHGINKDFLKNLKDIKKEMGIEE